MTPAERLTAATQGLKAAANQYSAAKGSRDAASALHRLCLTAEYYIEARTAFRAWLDTLPHPKGDTTPTPGG